jgi:hypothetical protein
MKDEKRKFPWLKVQCLAYMEVKGSLVYCEEALYIGADHCRNCEIYKKWKEKKKKIAS